MTTKADYLKFYSEKGWQVFPVKAMDKTPLVKWADVATTELNMLYGWLEHYPDMNIGLATGKRSGIFVLDVDVSHDGFQSLETLEKQYGALPKTPVVQTGGGGRHYFFSHPEVEIRNVQNSGKLGKGLDIRGDGGYVVAAGSIHKNGNPYKWLIPPSQVELANAPQWMIDLLLSSAPVKVYQPGEPVIPNGGRNNTLTSLAGSMRRKGMGEASIISALLIENKTKCIPPLSDDEVRQIAMSVVRYQPAVDFETNRDRLQTEWSFCASIYNFPSNSVDFGEISTEMFADHTLSDFWRGVQNNEEVTAAAVNAGILTELERYKDYDVSRLDGYAKSIQRFAHLAKIEKLGETLKRHAREANDAGIEKAITDINRIPSQMTGRAVSVGDVAEDVETYIKERERNPVDVWGIPYAWKRISVLTGGKQPGELILCAAEPKIGKSWWWLQDALETAIAETPVFYWCGEMKRTQLMRRFYQLLGVNGRNMKTGKMTEQDWDALNDAKALIMNSPLYIDDHALTLHEVRPLLVKQKQEHGIEQVVFDYAKLILAPGRDEIEQTQNTSIELKRVCQDLNLSITLIQSVNKLGMDGNSGFAAKSNVRGSGQQIHDADIIYVMTKFNGEKYGMDYGIMPHDYEDTVALHVTAGRELDHQVEGGFIPYARENNSPKFREVSRN